jgi:hypothetical protein
MYAPFSNNGTPWICDTLRLLQHQHLTLTLRVGFIYEITLTPSPTLPLEGGGQGEGGSFLGGIAVYRFWVKTAHTEYWLAMKKAGLSDPAFGI